MLLRERIHRMGYMGVNQAQALALIQSRINGPFIFMITITRIACQLVSLGKDRTLDTLSDN